MDRAEVQALVDQVYPEYKDQLRVVGSEEEWSEGPGLCFCGETYPKRRLLSAPTFGELARGLSKAARSGRFERKLYELWDDDLTQYILTTIEHWKEAECGRRRR